METREHESTRPVKLGERRAYQMWICGVDKSFWIRDNDVILVSKCQQSPTKLPIPKKNQAQRVICKSS